VLIYIFLFVLLVLETCISGGILLTSVYFTSGGLSDFILY
jgi:hypothetical protein